MTTHFRVRLVVDIFDASGLRPLRTSLPWKEGVGEVVVDRLRRGFERSAKDYKPRVEHTKRKGQVTVELTLPADGPGAAKRKMLYWVDRVALVTRVTFDHSRITEFEAEPVG